MNSMNNNKDVELYIEMLQLERNSRAMDKAVFMKEINKLRDEIAALEETNTKLCQSGLEQWGINVQEYSDISWTVEKIYNLPVSDSKKREMVRELLQESAKERYNKAMKHWNSDDCDNIKEAIKIASGYEGNS